MQRKISTFALAAATLFAIAVSAAFAFEPASDADAQSWRKRLVPLPVSVEFGTQTVVLDDSLNVTVAADEPEAAQEIVAQKFRQYFKVNPQITAAKPTEEIPLDGYRIIAERNSLQITVSNVVGALNAMKTLRQLAEPNRDSETVRAFYVPELKISDAPALAFRGLHLCWFPETDPVRIEQSIRMAAYYKFNYVVLEMWGTFRFEKRPDFCWAESAVGKDEIRRLVEIGRAEGITLVPQLNLFGHASFSRSVSSKHAVLDFHPEYLPLFEPDGWTWCLSNPTTRGVLTDLALELYDAFDAPPFFHLGCDEAHSAGTCPQCRKVDYLALLTDHLTYFNDLFKERGAKTMMWHDMLAARSEFPGYVANGVAQTAGLIDRLPKDIVVCDWQYGAPKQNETWPTTRYFKEKGFDVVVCPWNVRAGIESLGKLACDEKLFGLLETTWHHLDGAEMRTIFATGARSAWGTAHSGYDVGEVDSHLRQVGWDMDLERYRYEQTGVVPFQITPRPAGGR